MNRSCRRVRLFRADAGNTGKLSAWAAALRINVQIVAKRDRHALRSRSARMVERTSA